MTRTRRVCPACDVAWSGTTGDHCWCCGGEGQHDRYGWAYGWVHPTIGVAA